MKKYAGILNVLLLIAYWMVLIAVVVIAGLVAVCIVKGGIPYLLESFSKFVTIKALEGLKDIDYASLVLPITIAAIGAAVACVLTLLIISNLRKTVKEVREERPFSIESSSGLKTAGTLTMIDGIIGIAVQLVTSFLFARALGKNFSTNVTVSLSFLITAVVLFLLKEVADYGREHTI